MEISVGMFILICIIGGAIATDGGCLIPLGLLALLIICISLGAL